MVVGRRRIAIVLAGCLVLIFAAHLNGWDLGPIADGWLGGRRPTSAIVHDWVEEWVQRDGPQLEAPCRTFIESSPRYDARALNASIVPASDEVLRPSIEPHGEPAAESVPQDWYVAADAPKPPNTIFFISEYRLFPPPDFWDAFCALEAAAILNPSHRILVYSPRPNQLHAALDAHFGSSSELRSRIHPRVLDEVEILAGTPFEAWYATSEYTKSTWIDQNLSNAVRLALLWKEGGTYFDLDMIAMNPLSKASRALAREDWQFPINNAGLTFPPKDPFVFAAMTEFVNDFQGDRWGWQGPYLVTRTLTKTCPSLTRHSKVDTKLVVAPETADDPQICDRLTVFRPSRFYAVGLHSSLETFRLNWRSSEACKLMTTLHNEAIGLHIWHSKLKDLAWAPDTIYCRILQRSCPYTTYVSEQGW